jgi:hypothetical protein
VGERGREGESIREVVVEEQEGGREEGRSTMMYGQRVAYGQWGV